VAEYRRRWAFNEPSSKDIKAGQEAISRGQWKTFFIGIPMGFLPAFYILANEHHEERETAYPYLRIRAAGKGYPWGDDDLFEDKKH
jgi:hypothetical protein